MYRPLCIAAGMYVLGVLSEKYSFINLSFLFFLATGYILAVCLSTCKKKEFIYHLIIIFVGFVMVFVGKNRASTIKEVSDLQSVMKEIGTDSVKIRAYVDDVFYEKQGKKLVLSDLSIQNCGAEICVENEKIFLYTENEEVTAGESVMIYGSPVFYDESKNEGEFDIRKYYLTRNIAAYIYSDNISKIQKNELIFGKLKRGICLIREKLIANTEKSLPERESGIIISMLSGDKTYINADVKEDFQNTGFAHILAISGVKIQNLAIPLIAEIRINRAFVPLHIAKIYILKLCFNEEVSPRCRFPCSRGVIQKRNNMAKDVIN